ncbi:MAG: hypothetical protein RQ751_11080, partial [Longimicrobiales bacterium]|nr:hypothetical protein [Longimicrobiales bacterium]
RRTAERIRRAFAPGLPDHPAALTPHQAAEILLVARWFRLHPAERERTVAPKAWSGAAQRAERGAADAPANGVVARSA